MINLHFGSIDGMKEKFKTESLGRFGSGWVWLVQKRS
jgi:superoxide dismutase